MKYPRITAAIKADLRNLAIREIKVPVEQAALDKAYEAAIKLVVPEIIKRFPIADMEILRKYKTAVLVYEINKGHSFRDDLKFSFRADDERTPWQPDVGWNDIEVFDWKEKTVEAVIDYNRARNIYYKAREVKGAHYNTIISSATNLEQIINVWPAAKAIIPLYGNAPLVAKASWDFVSMDAVA